MDDAKYMWVTLKYLPEKIIESYYLCGNIHNGWVLVKIKRGMHGLPQSGNLAYDQLVENLAPYAYHPFRFPPVLQRHETQHVTFCPTVDNFGIKYVGEEHDEHLQLAIRKITRSPPKKGGIILRCNNQVELWARLCWHLCALIRQ